MPQPFAEPNPRPEADVSFVKRKFLDLSYATISEAQKLDIFLPDSGEGPFPVFFHVHGGGFEFGNKRSITLLPMLVGLKRGYAVVDINYRLSGEAIFPAAVQDVKAAIRWLRANQTKYHLDGKRIAVCGGSAGGNLVAMAGVTGHFRDFDDPNLGNMDQPSNVQAVVDMFGPIDFLAMDAHHKANNPEHDDRRPSSSPESRYIGAPIETVPERVKAANPTTYIHPGIPPFLIQHGSKDKLVPVQQSIDFASQLQEKAGDGKASLTIFDDADHGDPIFETEENMDKVFGFIDSVLK
jgi:acetyl esterase/lipase